MSKPKKPARSRVESSFSSNLKAIMKERGLTQRATAEMAGVTAPTINDWLSGSQPNDPNAVLKLAKGLGCDFQWLLTSEPSSVNRNSATLAEVFDIEDDASFSGIFMVEAKRLKPKGD